MAPKFSLQPVLDYRHSRVEVLEVELSNLLSEKQKGISYLDALNNYKQQLFNDLHNQQDGEIDLAATGHVRSTVKRVEQRIHQQKVVLSELDKQVNIKRAEVVGAKQDEETLVTLKNKEIDRYRAEQAQQENRLQDDIYISQAYRRTGSNKGVLSG
jgi:flagellar export protein FliJ